MFAGLWPGPVLLNGLNADKALHGGTWEGSSCSGRLLAASAGGMQDEGAGGRLAPAYEHVRVGEEIARRDGTINIGLNRAKGGGGRLIEHFARRQGGRT